MKINNQNLTTLTCHCGRYAKSVPMDGFCLPAQRNILMSQEATAPQANLDAAVRSPAAIYKNIHTVILSGSEVSGENWQASTIIKQFRRQPEWFCAV